MRQRIEELCFAESLGLVIWVSIVPLLAVIYFARNDASDERGCGGDGGVPYAAPASQLGGFCRHLDSGLSTWLVYPVPLLMAAIGFVLVYVSRRGWRPTTWKVTAICIGLAVVVGSLVPPATVIYLKNTMSTACQGDHDYHSVECNHLGGPP
jgi:hypothetical protein